MTFGTDAARGDRDRMKNALGRWSAQYQKQPPASYQGSGTGVLEPPPEPAKTESAPVDPQLQGSAPSENCTGAEAPPPVGDSGEASFTHGPAAEDAHQEHAQAHGERTDAKPAFIDYYEILQISRNADAETIHRVYRIMAARFHPDNPRTGDTERFQLLRRAYHVLSDAVRRAEYDRSYTWAETHTMPIFELREFVDGVDGEKNRRLGVLSLLYHRRRISEVKPGVSVLDLEQRMGLPREYLNFTLWYLKAKGFVRFEDNSDFGLTVEGVDYLEANSIQNTIIRELLEAGTKGESGAGTGSPDPSDATGIPN